MGNQPCGGDCFPDPDSSMRMSYPGNEYVLADLNRPSDEKRYKIVYNGETMSKDIKDYTPRKTLNFDLAEGEPHHIERPFDMSFSQSMILPAQDSFSAVGQARGQPLTTVSQQQQLTSSQQWHLAPAKGYFPKGNFVPRFGEGQRHWGMVSEGKENRGQYR